VKWRLVGLRRSRANRLERVSERERAAASTEPSGSSTIERTDFTSAPSKIPLRFARLDLRGRVRYFDRLLQCIASVTKALENQLSRTEEEWGVNCSPLIYENEQTSQTQSCCTRR